MDSCIPASHFEHGRRQLLTLEDENKYHACVLNNRNGLCMGTKDQIEVHEALMA